MIVIVPCDVFWRDYLVFTVSVSEARTTKCVGFDSVKEDQKTNVFCSMFNVNTCAVNFGQFDQNCAVSFLVRVVID